MEILRAAHLKQKLHIIVFYMYRIKQLLTIHD